MVDLNKEQKDILEHTAKNHQGLYCGGSRDMDFLCANGLMESAGRKSFVPDEYYRITGEGKLRSKT